MPIVPDAKDWGWVLKRPCDECGFDASTFPREQIGTLIRTNTQDWQVILAGPPARLRRRLRDDRWSPLEYACHVRDVLLLFEERLVLMLTMDNPTFPYWDQDQAAVEGHYREQDPVGVARRLVSAGKDLAERFDGVEGADWARTGDRSDGTQFTVDMLGRWVAHDAVHHLYDANVDLATLLQG
jgi:hypothetical protein